MKAPEAQAALELIKAQAGAFTKICEAIAPDDPQALASDTLESLAALAGEEAEETTEETEDAA
jgi:hypothetical protein